MGKISIIGMVLGLSFLSLSNALAATHVPEDLSRIQSANHIDPDSGLAAYWSFDNGTASDNSGNGHSGIVYGATPIAGISDSALEFDGIDDYIDFGDVDDMENESEITFSFWVRFYSFGSFPDNNFMPLITKWYSGEVGGRNSYHFLERGGFFQFAIQDTEFATSVAIFKHSMALNKWYHLAVVFDSGRLEVYAQDTLIYDTTLDVQFIGNSTEALRIGNWFHLYLPEYKLFHGSLDEVRIYKRALSYAEIVCLSGNSPEPTLVNDDLLHIINHFPQFVWPSSSICGPQDSFQIQIGTDSDWAFAEMWNPAPVASADTFVTYAGAPLVDGATYYLRLRVHNGVVWSNWYQTSFRMNSVPTIPVLTWPDSGAVVNTATPTLYVHNATDAESDTLTYEFSITNHSMWGPPQTTTGINIPSGVDSTGWAVTPPLNENWQYIWQARCFDGYEYSDWTPYGERRNLYVNAVEESPWPFELVKPPDTSGNMVFNMLPYFFWGISIDADPLDSVRYTLYLALDSNFQFIQTIEIPENQYTPTDSLFFGTRYWWKVKATDKTGRFTYSTDIHNFRTWKLGDANGDWLVNIQDITFIINFLYNEGAEPKPKFVADINGTCLVNIQDITYLINYLYKGGPAPKIGCTP